MKEFLKELKKSRTLLLMLAPAVVIIFIFAYLPMGGMVLAFKQYNYRDGIWGSPWVTGIFDNFRFFFMSGKAFAVTANTFSYNLCFIAVNTFLAVLFAVILSEARGKKFKKVTQSSIFLPYFVSWVIVGTIAYNLLNYENGVVNGVLKTLGMEPINLYADGPAWRVLIVLFNAWKSVGYGSILYLASIMGIDTSIYEAAEIDGANRLQTLFKIKIPMVMSSVTICIFLTLTNSFKLFDQNLALTGGDPNHMTDMMALNIYNTFYARSGMQWKGYGQAKAVIFCALVIFISLFQLRATRSREVQQ